MVLVSYLPSTYYYAIKNILNFNFKNLEIFSSTNNFVSCFFSVRRILPLNKRIIMELTENITAFHHVSIKAQDFDNTVLFYRQLGFEVVHDWSLPDFNLEKCAMLHNKKINYYLEICDKNSDIPTQGRKRDEEDEYVENALLHICFTVKNAEEAMEKALEHGAKDLSEGVFQLDLINKYKSVHVKNSLVYSPNGEVIEFLENVDFG